MSTSSSPAARDGDTFVCECEELGRRACRDEGFYKERDGKRYCVLHYPGIEKKEEFAIALRRKLEEDDFDFQGVWFPDLADFSGHAFNSYASFSNALFNGPADFNGAQFKSAADFNSALFSAGATFISAKFSASADFSNAGFIADANFINAWFSADAYFTSARFSVLASFIRARFGADAYFDDTLFGAGASFLNTCFDATVYFRTTTFFEIDAFYEESATSSNKASGAGDAVETKAEQLWVNFGSAIFKEGVNFEESVFADQVLMRFAAAIFEKPERAVFHSTVLRPHWFVNVDSRKLTFINVDWRFLNKRDAVRKERAALESSGERHVSRLLEVTFRQLAVNAEENNRYEEAANFRYWAMEVRRQQRGRKFDPFRLIWWYWLLSGYGERVQRAFGTLLTIWLLFAVVYWAGDATWWQPRQSSKLAAEVRAREQQSPHDASKQQPSVAAQQPTAAASLTLPESLIYSAGVMSLQKPEPLPANKRAKAFVLLETILGPVQAALLALAIRRKFMR